MKKPKRVTPKDIIKNTSTSTEATRSPSENNEGFKLPTAHLDLDFFLKKSGKQYTPEELISEVFGPLGLSLTESEKVYCLLKALEPLEITMPFEFECPQCHKGNPVAIEADKVMTTTGEPKESFECAVGDYLFVFKRPEVIQDHQQVPGIAGIGMYMLQWLVGHNQDPDFEFFHLPISDIIKLAEQFAKNMFGVEFKVDCPCAFCKAPIREEFGIGVQDITTIINEL